MNNEKYNLIFIVFIALFLIFLISGCTITEENVDEIAAKMQEAYDKINTLKVHKEEIFKVKYNPEEMSQENLNNDIRRGAVLSGGYIITKFVTDTFIEKPGKEKTEFSRNEGYIADQISKLIIENELYEEFADKTYRFTCAEQIRKEPNFVKYLKDILNKYNNMELAGKETISGKEAYKLKLETDHFIWIDKGTYLPLRESNGLNEVVYSNYKINEAIQDSIFSTPSNKKLIEQGCPSEKKVPKASESAEEQLPAKPALEEAPAAIPRKTMVEGDTCDAQSTKDVIACTDYCISIGKNVMSCDEGACKCP
ncbi:outer membrane lipoprotein carrier protein LolA [Candidatus Woesearchaeota archaeon]|nr:outer membrane lipoprotein carrier protein LolA [Candidatus Woesearchaeota archaeon]